jgi:hypothetical protein
VLKRIYEAWGWATHGREEVWVAAGPSSADGWYPKPVSMAATHKYERNWNTAFRTPENNSIIILYVLWDIQAPE